MSTGPMIKLEPVERTYVIGDIHGCVGQFRDLLRVIRADILQVSPKSARIVFLGDYIDRGTYSASVVKMVRSLDDDAASGESGILDVFCLKGNHEAMALKALQKGDTDHWFANGGLATLDSYREKAIRSDDLLWMANLATLAFDGVRYYVHAGLKPGVRPEETADKDRLWIRGEFLDAKPWLGRHIVHGHTPDDSFPEVYPWRTNLDTGCFSTGVLSCGVFDANQGPPIEIIRTTPNGVERTPPLMKDAA